jgi:hypothetical protein
MDSARPHVAKKVPEFVAGNGMKRTPRPLYSPDLTPCDFCLFGHINGRLTGASFDPGRLLQAIDAFFQSIEKPRWNACFRSGWTDWGNVVCQLMV